MKIWFGILLAVSCAAQDAVTTDDMWDALLGRGGPAAVEETDKAAQEKRLDEVIEIIRRRMAERKEPGIAGPVEWKEANLSMELWDGWQRMPAPLPESLARMYYHPGNTLVCSVVFVPLAADQTSPIDEIFDKHLRNRSSRLRDVKKVEADGKAAELGMLVAEGSSNAAGGVQRIVMGCMLRNGALYNINMVAEEIETAREAFGRFMAGLRLLDPEADLSLPPARELAVPAVGFRGSLAGMRLAATDPELPHGSAAMYIDSRFEIAAFDMRDCAVPTREAAESFLNLLNMTAGKPHESREFEWAGIPGLRFTNKEPSQVLALDMDWGMACAMHKGFFCVAMGYWPAGDETASRQFDKLVADTTFGDVGEIQTPPENPAKCHWLGHFYNEAGLKAFQRGQFGLSSPAFERATKLVPEDPMVVQNLLQSLTQQGRTQAALDAVSAARKGLPDHEALLEWHACLLIQCTRGAEADPLFEKLLTGGLRNRESLFLWIESLQQRAKFERATALAGSLFEETGQSVWRRVLANCLWSESKPAEALAHYDAIAADFGMDPGFAADHATLLLECGEHRRTVDLATAWEKSGEPPPAMRFAKGMAQSHLGWFKEAVATFTELDRQMPGNQTVQEALTHARGMLGQGSQEGLRYDLAAVEIPDVLAKHSASALKDANITEDFPGEGWITLEEIRVWHWRQGADAKVTHRRKIRILDASGVATFSTLYIPLRPAAERVNVHRMVVTAADGTTLEEYKRGELHVRDANTGLADGHKLLCIPVPTLAEGATIDFEYTISQLGTADRFPMTTETFQRQSPVIYGAVAFTGEVEKIRFASSEQLDAVDGDGMRAFEARMVRRASGSNYLPPFEQWGLLCWATDARATWEKETAEYLAEIDDCLADDAFAAKAVDELGLEKMSRRDAVRAVVRWLNDKFQYQGIEFGRRARMPAKGAVTLQRGYGDCKDLSVMVRAILRAAGIEARLALVNSNGIVRAELPGLDQFDHMILHLPEDGLFLDPTLKMFNTPEALYQNALGSRALVIEGGGPEFVEMRETPGVDRSARIDRTVRIDPESGDATVEETVELSPAMASVMRMMVSSTPGVDRREMFESLMRRREPRMEWSRFEADNLENPFLPLVLRSVYRINDAFHTEEDSLAGGVPPVIERMVFELAPDRDRNLGMHVRAAENCRSKTRYVLPAGYRWRTPDSPQHAVSGGGLFEGSLQWSGGPEEAVLDASLKMIPGTGDAARYAEVRKANEELLRRMDRRIRFQAE